MATPRLCKIEGCGKPAVKREWCSSHYRRWQRHGDPLAGRTPWGEPARFLREVVLTYEGNECLLWPFGTDSAGYGRLRIGKGKKDVHRLVCEEVNGPSPTPGHEAAHSCGKGRSGCVTKGHLSWKTHAQNEADKIEHGTDPRGERNGSAKLTVEVVRKIRALRGVRSQSQIAKQFGIARSHISTIQTGKSWAWLP